MSLQSEAVEVVVIGLLVTFPIIGFVVRRWFVLIFPIAGWPLFYAGLTHHWWGYGTGDGWQYVAVALSIVGIGSTAVAVKVGQAMRPPPAPPLLRS